jgi:hypothetical protein
MVKLSHYVIQFFVDRGLRDTFSASGGGIIRTEIIADDEKIPMMQPQEGAA